MRAGRLVGTVAVSTLFLEAGCGLFGSSHPKAPLSVIDTRGSTTTIALQGGVGLELPRTLDGFELTRRPDQRATGVTAVYTRSGPTPLVATVSATRMKQGGSMLSLTSVSTIASAKQSGKVLDATMSQLRAAHPGLSATPLRDVYLLRFGAIQVGQAAEVTFDGPGQAPTTISVDTFCCVNGMWSYEYRFQNTGAAEKETQSRFMRDLPWSADPRASIDEPR